MKSRPPVKASRKPPARRMGPAGSATWHAILDGAEEILREEGYAALNARKIADRVGIKRQLVYYYFRDNDALFVEMFNRLAGRELDRLKSALETDRPLRETWDAGIFTIDTMLVSEFLVLANRNPAVREAVVKYVAVARDIQIAALNKALKGRKFPQMDMPLAALAVLATGVAFVLPREAALGFTNGHQEILHVIEKFLTQTEAGRTPGKQRATAR